MFIQKIFENFLQMLSAQTGEEQFMFRAGLLRSESNILWRQEFVGYHGLQSVSDIPLTTLTIVSCGRLSEYDLECCSSLGKRLAPLMRNPISFQLITMIMLLDTSNINTTNLTPSEKQLDDDSTQSSSSLEECVPPLREICLRNYLNDTGLTLKERFHGVRTLQDHYMHLLKVHCKFMGEENGGYLGNTDERLFETMGCIRKVAEYSLAFTKA